MSRMGERELVLLMGLLTALSSLAIDLLLPAFAQMRPAFGLFGLWLARFSLCNAVHVAVFPSGIRGRSDR